MSQCVVFIAGKLRHNEVLEMQPKTCRRRQVCDLCIKLSRPKAAGTHSSHSAPPLMDEAGDDEWMDVPRSLHTSISVSEH